MDPFYPMKMPELVVQKYGGMCLATPEKIVTTAKKIARRFHEGHKMMIVVSAMGKSTDEMIRLAYQVSRNPNRRELDMFLSTGERVSMSLLSMALTDLGCKAISFTGSQAGVFTDHSHSHAKIVDIRPHRLHDELNAGKIVVLAGFQGVDPQTKEITTLGRGGSDTTAVAMAAAFQAKACEIIKEVDGLGSADPRLVPHAKIYPSMNYDELLEMCFWGAKVLHYRSVELAKTKKVPLSIHHFQNSQTGTLIRSEPALFENQQILSINSHHDIHHVEIANVASVSEGLEQLKIQLQTRQLAWPQILAATMDNGQMRAMYTSDLEHLSSLSRMINESFNLRHPREPLSSISITCHGAVASDLGYRITHILQKTQIQIEKILLSPLSLTIILDPKAREAAIQILHDHFL